MPVVSSNLASSSAATASVKVEKGQTFMFNVGGTFVGTWSLQFKADGQATWKNIGKDYTSGKSKSGDSPLRGDYRIQMSAYTSGTAVASIFS